MTSPERDPRFRVEVLNATLQPQTTIWAALHQDYSEDFVFDEKAPPEDEAGRIIVKRLLAGERGHYGPLEHPEITFAVGYFPHSVMQQARTHRIGCSFDTQSFRYTGARVCAAARGELHLEDVFYLRPLGTYTDRQGKHYEYTPEQRTEDLEHLRTLAWHYLRRVEHRGFAEEHARGLLAFDVRQHFVVSFTLRALLHFLDLRARRDAQLEIQQMCELMIPHLKVWAPEIAEWYCSVRLHKGRLAP